MASLSKDLIFLILQFLEEEKLGETVRMLEQETGLFLSLKYLEELVLGGNWDAVEKYLSGFTKVDSNRYSMKMFFEIRKQKYFEALDKHDRANAIEILMKDLKVFASFNEELFKEITQLLTLDNIRENHQLSNYSDVKSTRAILLAEIKKLLEMNPLCRDKLQFPNIKSARLRTLVNQSLNWQHSLCGNPRAVPDIRTLFVDHHCRNSTDQYSQLTVNNQMTVSAPRNDGFLSMSVNGVQPTSAPGQVPLSTWMSTQSSITHPVVPGGGTGFAGPLNAGVGAQSAPPGAQSAAPGAQSAVPGNSDSMSKMVSPGSHGLAPNITDELPNIVARTLEQGSNATSMDFHPTQQTLLLVGTNIGDISLWEVSSREMLLSKNFQVWNIAASSMTLKAALIKDPCVSVRRIVWSPDGSIFGVAYSKHLVQMYAFLGAYYIRQHLEIECHAGAVNDLAFCYPSKQLALMTCGDDKMIKVWDVVTGAKLYTFEGHEAAVHSVCPHNKDSVHFFFSTSMDGKIKAWLYDSVGYRVDYYAPGHSCSALAYSADGKRLFSCGTNREGDSHLVEWNENEGTVKRTYQGLHKRSAGIVKFDIAKNRFLAVGDDSSIKIWHMDNTILLETISAEGRLPANPSIRFNNEGSLLAVSANDNKVKILATVDGLRLMRTYEGHSLLASRVAAEIEPKNGDSRILEEAKARAVEVNLTKAWKLTDINAPAQFRSLKLTSHFKTDKIFRLIYNNSGNAILALAFNAIHLLWKWTRNDLNPNGKATTKVNPYLVQPASGILMTNDLVSASPEKMLPCFALSKNDSYVVSASGGKVSLFNMMTFKIMATFMPPPPATTYLAFHPQDNNIIAVGMDDSTIHIYNVREDSIKNKLHGHSKRITGLAFSHLLNALISSSADAQIMVWNYNSWERQTCFPLQIPAERTPRAVLDTQVEFHKDQMHLLAVNEIQLAIYDMRKAECIKQWIIGESSTQISHATFSCDGQLVYSTFLDGTLRIFTASTLQLQCQINPTAYLPADISVSTGLCPLVVAANPHDPNQFAIGLSDGNIYVFEPLESEGKWGLPPPVNNGSASGIASTPLVVACDQTQAQ